MSEKPRGSMSLSARRNLRRFLASRLRLPPSSAVFDPVAIEVILETELRASKAEVFVFHISGGDVLRYPVAAHGFGLGTQKYVWCPYASVVFSNTTPKTDPQKRCPCLCPSSTEFSPEGCSTRHVRTPHIASHLAMLRRVPAARPSTCLNPAHF